MKFLQIMKKLFLVASFSLISLLSFAADFFTGPLTKIANIGFDKDIFLVEDACKKQFILKYNTKSFISTSETSIHEALGAKIGMAAGIPINDVRIFAPHDTSLGCVDCYPHLCKTLHTVVPGKEVCCAEIPYSVHLQFTGPETLTSLTHHIDLRKIAALDLFTSNFDRHIRNLFFDDKTNRFYAIDMDWIFNDVYHIFKHAYIDINAGLPETIFKFDNPLTPLFAKLKSALKDVPFIGKTALTPHLLAVGVYNFLKTMDPKKLSDKEIEALKEVSDTLYILQTMYPPKKLYEEWMNIAQEAKYTYDPKKQQYIRYLISYNHREITKIRAQINRLISADTNTVSAHTQKVKDFITINWQNVSLKMLALQITLNNYQTT